MAGKIRVYELARELGLTNKEMLDLCAGLGIGVKSHSSSIEEAQADRARRKAEREGLRRDVQPEEPGVPKRMPPRRLGVPESVGTGQERVLSVTGEEHLEASAVRGSSASRPPMSASAPGEPSEPGLAGSLEAQTSGPQLEGELDAQLSTAESQRVEGGRGASELAGAEAGSPLEAPPFGAPGTEASPSGSAAERKEPIPGSPQQPTGRLRPAMPPPRPAAGGPTRPPAPTTPPPGPRSSPGQPAPSVPPPPPVGRGQAIPPPPPRSPRPAGQQPSGSGRPVPGSGRPAGPGGPPRPAGGPPQPSESRPAPGGEAPSRPAAAAGPGGPGAPPRGAGGAGAPSGPRAGAASGAGPATPGAPSRGTGAPGGPKPPAAPPRGAGGRPIPPPPGVMRSASGRPIPPPPGGPPRSASGKPIPPPPGLGGRGPQSGASRPGGGGGGRPAGAGGGAGRPGGGGGGRPGGYTAGRPGGGQFPRSSVPGAGVGRGAPGGGPSGRGSPGAGRPRPQQRRPRRRRRSFEELSPTELTTYSPSSAPVPEGEIVVERGISAQELGPKLNRTAADVVRFLFQMGEMVTATQSLTDDMIELFAQELGAEVLLVDPGQQQELQLQEMLSEDEEEDDEGNLRPRPPVITVMGHVDHGKTLLLDRIREANVVAGEAGGITQHIGAYQVTKDAKLITFIDTPGHQAFTAMRARGAEVTDIVVLVVAADDGVMPQTIEAINHAKAAEVPIIVAINKVDRDNADPNRVKQQLAEQGLVPEEWGGDTIMVEISALHNLGIDDLLDQLLVVAELEELVANPEGRARGVVLEANLDVGRGPVATVLVEKGTLQVGAPIVAGAAWGRVRALIDDNGDQVKEALPSTPVQVLGLSAVPSAGDEFRVAPDDRTARTVAEARERRYRERALKTAPGVTGGARLEDIFEQIQRGETATLNLILKADVHGSLEAATESLKKLERDEVKLAFVHRAVGGITEYDIQLAAASNATIIGFNVRPDRRARELAEAHDVEIRTYEIIYKLLEDIEAAMVGMLAPEYEEVVAGDAEVREVFSVPRVGKIAGCYVQNGTIARGAKVRFLREGTIIWKGTITSLKRFKDDVREVQAGFECGIGLSDFQDLKPGDIIETYEEREIPRS